MTIRAGIIGTGGIARAHAEGYRKNGVEITALMDAYPQAAESFNQSIGGKARIFPDYRSLLDSGLVDLVSICTPPAFHEEPAVLALQRNIHVLLEKPMAQSVQAARNIEAASQASPALLTIGFRHRCLPAVQKLRSLIQEGAIGQLVFFQNIFCGPAFDMKDKWFSKKAIAGGGTMMDTSVHSVDLFRFLAGEVSEQKAVAATHLEGIDVEDASIMTVKAENGCLGALTAAWVAGDGQAFIDITGTGGRVRYDYYNAGQVKLRKLGEKEWQTFEVQPSDGFAEEIAIFLKAIAGQGDLLCTAYEGHRAIEIIQANY
jgi:predicted dehydrogenase